MGVHETNRNTQLVDAHPHGFCEVRVVADDHGHLAVPANRVENEVHGLIADIEKRVKGLAPRLPVAFYSDVTALSSSVGKLRRIARIARDAAQGDRRLDAAAARHRNRHADSSDGIGGRASGRSRTRARGGSGEGEDAAAAGAVRSGDEATFAGFVEPYRRELQMHCYRMVGSYDDSEDLVQETFLRAWRRRDGFEGRSTLRAWLYRIATNACLDFLRRHTRRPQRYETPPGTDHGSGEPPARVTWLQPYPDQLLEAVPSAEAGPDAAVVSRETIELVFLAAIQHLPPRQRAVLILRDVLGWPAADTAALLEMSVASVNSALQRARPTLRKQMPERRTEWAASADPTEEESATLRRYMDAARRTDFAAMAELLSEDVKVTMPPNPMWFVGRETFLAFLAQTLDPGSPQYFGDWRHVVTRANGQPATAGYVQRPGTTVYRAQVLDVLRIEDGKIAEITAFEPHLFPAFGLPLTL